MPGYEDMQTSMADLCEWVSASELSNSIFGTTSMHTLMIFQKDIESETRQRSQYLKIEPNFETKKIDFTFMDTYTIEKQWKRTEEPFAEDLIKRLIGFMKQIHWIEKDYQRYYPTP